MITAFTPRDFWRTLNGCTQAFSTSFTFCKGICSFQARAVAEEFLTVPKEFLTWKHWLYGPYFTHFANYPVFVSSKKELFLTRVTCNKIVHTFGPRQVKEVHDKSGHLFRLQTQVLVSQSNDRPRKFDRQSSCRLQVCRELVTSHFWFPASWPHSAKLCKRPLHPRIEHPTGVSDQQNYLVWSVRFQS